jgi:hypothetical protein
MEEQELDQMDVKMEFLHTAAIISRVNSGILRANFNNCKGKRDKIPDSRIRRSERCFRFVPKSCA